MVLSHERLKVGRSNLIGPALSGSPFHEEAVGDSAKHAKHPHPIVTLNSAAVVIVGDVQTLVKPALDAPTRPVQVQPSLGLKLGAGRAGDQGHLFIFSPFGLAQEARRLRRHGKADVLRRDSRRADHTVFRSPFVLLLRAGFCERRLLKKENPLGERILSFRCSPVEWADCF